MALLREKVAGQESVTHSARWTVIRRILLKQGPVFQLVLLPPLLAALIEMEWQLALALAVSATVVAISTAMYRKVALPTDIRRVEAVLSVGMMFLVGVVLTTPAYLTLGLMPVDGFFEAASALTTTGFSMISNPENLPLSAHILRAWSQWCGGLAIAVAGLAFLMDRGPVARALGFVDFGEERLESSTRRHARALIWAYIGLTAFGILGAAVLFSGDIDGPLLALSAVSTGGMAPRSDSLASYADVAQAFIVLLSMAGAVSLAFPVLAHRRGVVEAWRSSSLPSFLATFLVGISLGLLVSAISGIREPIEFWRATLNLLSLQSTTGFTVGPINSGPPMLILLVTLMAIGGETGSSAGGLKIERLRIMLATVSLTFRRLLSPRKALLYVKVDGEVVDAERIIFTVALFVVYATAAFFLWAVFTLHGYPPLQSLFDSISTLSTVGAETGVISPEMPPVLKVMTALAMLLGRVEFFGLLMLVYPRTWNRGD